MPAKEKRIEKIERGRMAAVVSGATADYVQAVQADILSLAKASYRTGTMTHDQMVGTIAGLVALDNLVSKMESDERQGILAFGEEITNG